MIKVGIYFAYWTHEWTGDYLYYLNKIEKLGFDVFELGSAALLDMRQSDRDILKQASKDKGIELTYCIGMPKEYDMASEDETVRRRGIEYAKRTVEAIASMEGKIFGGINYTSWPGVPDYGLTDKRPFVDRSIACMKEVAKTAEDCGVTYCLEVVNRYEQFLINTAAEGVEFAKRVGSPNVKLLLDAFHMNIEEDNMGEAILAAGDYIGHFHIGETNRKTPGKGRMPWKEITGALKKCGYTGRIVMEPFVMMGGEVGRDIKVWRELENYPGEEKLDADAQDALLFMRNLL